MRYFHEEIRRSTSFGEVVTDGGSLTYCPSSLKAVTNL